MATEIRQDRSFPRVLRRVTEEALWFQNQQFSDESSSLTSVREAESILQTVAEADGDSEGFSTLESELDSEHSVQSNYRSSHNTPCRIQVYIGRIHTVPLDNLSLGYLCR